MDSFFLAEMFKYLFLLFAEEEDLPFDVEDYVFTTEAHLLPLSLSTTLLSKLASTDNSTVMSANNAIICCLAKKKQCCLDINKWIRGFDYVITAVINMFQLLTV